MSIFNVTAPEQIKEALDWALSEKQALAIAGNNTKESLGHPVDSAAALNLNALTGVTLYEPAELVMQAGAGSLLVDIEKTLSENDQRLAFCPPDLGPMLGKEAGCATLGGIFCCNLSGSQRIKMGAARDHLLGVNGFTGRAQAFHTGSRVMKNVTGYDLCKLIAGSYGTLTVCTDFTFKVLPRPDKMRTVLLYGQEPNAAVVTMRDAMSSIHEVAGAAYFPPNIAARAGIDYVSNQSEPVTAILIDGAGPSVEFRLQALRQLFKGKGDIEELHTMRTRDFWQFAANVGAFTADQSRIVWRVSVPPSEAADYVFRLKQEFMDLEYYLDWAGGLIWLSLPVDTEKGGADKTRGEIRNGGHATLIRAPLELRKQISVFQPQDPVTARISEKIRKGFDPQRILNPGRTYAIN